jgi:hypothetical protein
MKMASSKPSLHAERATPAKWLALEETIKQAAKVALMKNRIITVYIGNIVCRNNSWA